MSKVLPRLMYVGSVPVEATSAGSALLFRLLELYPPDRLLIAEDIERRSAAGRRLPGVRYEVLPRPWDRGWRFLKTRMPGAFWPVFEAYNGHLARRCTALIRRFEAEAILTVHELFTWVLADQIARQHRLPLHLILHDEWIRNIEAAAAFHAPSERYISAVYRRARSRLCVCPYMEEAYRKRFGCKGSVLYPCRRFGSIEYPSPPDRLHVEPKRPVAVYAGNIFNRAFWHALKWVAEALSPRDGKLILYTPYSSTDCARHGLPPQNIECRAMVAWDTLAAQLRHEADFLFLPMSFDSADRPNAIVSFPSKLVDYTSTGVPLLIYGPHYASAIRWAKDHPGVAEVVERQSETLLMEAIDRLLNDPDHRRCLGLRSLEVGRTCFSYTAAENVLHTELNRGAA